MHENMREFQRSVGGAGVHFVQRESFQAELLLKCVQVVEEHPLGLASLWLQRAEQRGEAGEAGADAEPFTTWKFRPGEVSRRISDYIWCAWVAPGTAWL